MVANLQQNVPSQDILYGVEQVMSKQITFTDTNPVNVGGLPANAVVLGAIVATLTAFNAATNNNIDIGFTDATATVGNAYVAGQAIGPAGTVAPTMATTTNTPLSRPTTVTATYKPTGGGQTAGVAVVIVRFVVPRPA